MISSKELFSICLAILVLAFSNSFTNVNSFLISLLLFAIIILVYVGSKKLMAYYLEAEEETKIWALKRYGWYEKSHFKTPLPLGIIFPFILSILSLGLVKWFAVLESDVKTTVARASKKHDFYSYSELTEWHIGLISAAGIFSCFVLAIIAYILNYADLARLSVYYAAFNLIPFGKLDGMRIFFATRGAILWIILAVITLIGLFYASPFFY